MSGPSLRILVISHSHPKITNGGAEIAAYRLFTALSADGSSEAWFLGCNTQPTGGRDGIAITQPYSEREFVYAPSGGFDWFNFANRDPRFPEEFSQLLRSLRPNVVHLHHYVNFGVETIFLIRQVLPAAQIVITLHEYLAICNHFGQMVKRGDFALCEASGLSLCHACFPDVAETDFFLRDRYIKAFFDLVDHFIAPSRFLASRYIDWGVPAQKISVIENIIAEASAQDVSDRSRSNEKILRVGFFGQISRLKGINVLLDCAAAISDANNHSIVFEIFGDYKGQPEPFQKEFISQLSSLGRNVNYRGAYRQSEVDHLMRTVDAVLVPSIWWENSPVVIQEALRNGRPVLCSNIGGMAEKVRDGVDGIHFRVGSSIELSNLLRRLHEDPIILARIRMSMRNIAPIRSIVDEHAMVYRKGVMFTADPGSQ